LVEDINLLFRGSFEGSYHLVVFRELVGRKLVCVVIVLVYLGFRCIFNISGIRN